jgi:hypothetical protein
MFKVGIDKELNKRRKNTIDSVESVITEANRLLTAGADEEVKALRAAELDGQRKQVERAKGVEIERRDFEEKYDSHVFTQEEIKDICIKYDLRFLNSRDYIGTLDSEVATKLKYFIKNHPEAGGGYSAFYIMAPETSFHLDNRKEKSFLTVNVDPVLLYKLPGNENKYVYVHKWGKDFTILRRLRGMILQSTSNMWSFGISFWMIAITAIFGLLYDGFVAEPLQFLHFLWIGAASVFLTWATWALIFNDGEDFSDRTTPSVWNRSIKRRRG